MFAHCFSPWPAGLLLLSGDKAVHCGEDALAEAELFISWRSGNRRDRKGWDHKSCFKATPPMTKPHLLRTLLLSRSTD